MKSEKVRIHTSYAILYTTVYYNIITAVINIVGLGFGFGFLLILALVPRVPPQ